MVTDSDASKNLATRSQHDIIANLGSQRWVEFHVGVLAAQRDSLEYSRVTSHLVCSDYGPHGMGEKNPWADLTFGSNFQAKEHQIHISQKVGKDRDAGEHGCPAGPA